MTHDQGSSPLPLPLPRRGACALITGASSGIGADMARELATRGHALMLVSRRAEALTALADELRTDHGVAIDIIACDLADRDARMMLLVKLADHDIDILCSTASTAGDARLIGADIGHELDQIELNIVALHDLVLTILPGMVRRGIGAILVTDAGRQVLPNGTTHAATQAFVSRFTEQLGKELCGTGVTCAMLAGLRQIAAYQPDFFGIAGC